MFDSVSSIWINKKVKRQKFEQEERVVSWNGNTLLEERKQGLESLDYMQFHNKKDT